MSVSPPTKASPLYDERVRMHRASGHGATTSATRVCLSVLQPDGTEGERIQLRREPVYIGRRNATLNFPDDPFISRQHAVVVPEEMGASIIDLNSRNGVYVRIDKPELLNIGEMFLLGRQLLRFAAPHSDGQRVPVTEDDVAIFGSVFDPGWGKVLRVAVGGTVADSHLLIQDQVVFGRDTGDIIFHDDPFISRRHAMLKRERSGALLTDLGSANGSYRRIRPNCPVALAVDSWFRVGDKLLQLSLA